MIISSARSGNVIGGGDWSEDRIIPDIVNSLIENSKVSIRNPSSNRPWQVLEPLNGIVISRKTYEKSSSDDYEGANFDPNICSNKTVLDLVKKF